MWKPGTFIYPIPAVMVSCGTMEKSNIITVAWTGILNTNPAMVYISVKPERFSYDLIKKAHESIRKKDMTAITDDAMVVEQESGVQVRLVEGSYQNIKITTPEDLDVAEVFLKKIEKM